MLTKSRLALVGLGAIGIAALISMDEVAARDETIIPVSNLEPWQQSSSVNSSYNFTCLNHQIVFSLERSASGVTLTELKLNDKPVETDALDRISAGVTEMGGFDYPFVFCTSENVKLGFERKNIESDDQVDKFAVTL